MVSFLVGSDLNVLVRTEREPTLLLFRGSGSVIWAWTSLKTPKLGKIKAHHL